MEIRTMPLPLTWGGTWIRRTTPFREAAVLTPLMAFLTHMQMCQVVKTNCVPRSWWNKQWVKSRSHLWLNLCSSTRDAALTKIFHILSNSFPPETVERLSMSASIEIEIKIEIVYNMYRMRRFCTKSRMRRLLSLGPPNQGLDSDPTDTRIPETTRVRTWSRGSGPYNHM
jgi:hypothetical protein